MNGEFEWIRIINEVLKMSALLMDTSFSLFGVDLNLFLIERFYQLN